MPPKTIGDIMSQPPVDIASPIFDASIVKSVGDLFTTEIPINNKIRKPYASELEYFKNNPTVGGMATEDKRIILNPYSKLSDKEKESVAKNEWLRLKIEENKFIPNFKLTEKQIKSFIGTPYEKDELAAKKSILGRIYSGDPSALDITKEQMDALNQLIGPTVK